MLKSREVHSVAPHLSIDAPVTTGGSRNFEGWGWRKAIYQMRIMYYTRFIRKRRLTENKFWGQL